MSLATTSGGMGGMSAGGAGAGMAMAHHAGAVARPAAPPPPSGGPIPGGGAAPPVNAAALGADLLDKSQGLSLKQVRNASHLPIVAVDLFASDPCVAMFPPKASSSKEGKDKNKAAEAAAPGLPSLVGKMKPVIHFKANDETAQKTLRKWLTKDKPYVALQSDAIAPAGGKNTDTVDLERPQQWLGLRRTADAPEFVRKTLPAATNTTATSALSEEDSHGVGFTIANSTLDGSEPQNDDFDRVVFKVRLHDKKKALTVLPEEATQLLIHQAQYHVAKHLKAPNMETDDDIVDYPCAVALPAWACHDAAVEALLDGTGGTSCVFQRSICALVGALRAPPTDGASSNSLLEAIQKVQQEKAQAFQIAKAKDPDATMNEDVSLVVVGMTDAGCEATAVQVSAMQPHLRDCLFGEIKVLSNVSYPSDDPVATMERCVKELDENLQAIAPDMDAPAMIAFYGTAKQQQSLQQRWEMGILKSKIAKGWHKIPVGTTKPDCIALGTAILGAVSHGRLKSIQEQGNKKPKAILAIRVANVAPVAVGVRMNYHGDKPKKWTPVKTIFDFDRRVPAGPYPMDMKASESVIHRQKDANSLSDEEFLKAAKDMEGKKGIPQREEAALNLRVQVMQKWTRDGEWKPVGDPKKILVLEEDNKDGSTKEIACEHVTLELALGPTGIITVSLFGERESVVQATVSARNSSLRFWLGIAFCILFFGGFLVKSYWEERVFERDTQRLLAYYKHVLPGSIQDGDEHNARYLVWKYRGKKEKLWRTLEKKYGEPVLNVWEWPDAEDGGEETPEEHNLDDEETKQDEKEEPDL